MGLWINAGVMLMSLSNWVQNRIAGGKKTYTQNGEELVFFIAWTWSGTQKGLFISPHEVLRHQHYQSSDL